MAIPKFILIAIAFAISGCQADADIPPQEEAVFEQEANLDGNETNLARVRGEELTPRTIEEIREIDLRALNEFWRKPSEEFANITDIHKKLIELTATDYGNMIVSKTTGRLLTDQMWFISFI